METKEIAKLIFSTPKWYASIPTIGGFMNAQSANRVKNRFNKGTLTHRMIELIFNHHGYFIADKSWVKK